MKNLKLFALGMFTAYLSVYISLCFAGIIESPLMPTKASAATMSSTALDSSLIYEFKSDLTNAGSTSTSDTASLGYDDSTDKLLLLFNKIRTALVMS